ncbi:YceI family protein [Desulfovibrio sp. X2]|uniref:YceI family protein n=1 Tax=Desulfovibrio sp. X2 TaxID=941449 RepID=UPI000358ABE2|nr:YceI family protein [Desulfovibrio sp. X2]EPR41089.1 YceI family protein [Desulfovibrio sp. X2]
MRVRLVGPWLAALFLALVLLPAPVPAASTAASTAASKAADTAAEQAAPATAWSIDPAHCSVNFTVRHIFVKIPGRFASYSGTVRFDPRNLAGSLIDVRIDVASIDTFVAKRDEDLRSADYFDAARYPEIRFTSGSIEHRGGSSYVARGKLTVKDVTQDFAMPFTYFGEKPSPIMPGKTVAGFESDFSVNLLAFHVGDGTAQKLGAMGRTANVALYMELLR